MNNPNEFDESKYEKSRQHVEKGVVAMWKAGAELQNIEYEVASGLERAGLVKVNVLINIKER